MDESIKIPNTHFKVDYIKQIKNKNRFLYFNNIGKGGIKIT